MAALSEIGFEAHWFHYKPSGYTGGFTTQSDEHNLLPGPGLMVVHCGLTLFQPNSAQRSSLAVGIRSFTPTNGTSVDFGSNPLNWPTSLYKPLGTLVMGFHVTRGDMKAWYYIQHWA